MNKIFPLLLGLLLVIAIPVFADTYIDSCQDLVLEGETYILNASIINGSGNCIDIKNDSITLDCAGYTIDGSNDGESGGINLRSSPLLNSHIIIKNCIITEWGRGIHTNQGENLTVDNCTVFSNLGNGIELLYYNDTVITNTKIYDNGNNALRFTEVNGSTTYNNLINGTLSFTGSNENWVWNTTRQAGSRIYSDGLDIGGNYYTNSTGNGYSDTCTDADVDGICDTGYNLSSIGGIGYDYHPLSDEYDYHYLTDCTNPTLNVAGETYYLTQDIINTSETNCFIFRADDVTLDCQGHTIDGIDGGTSAGVYASSGQNSDHATIKNCIISDFTYGHFINYAWHFVSENVTTMSNTYGIWIVGTYTSSPDYNNTIYDFTSIADANGIRNGDADGTEVYGARIYNSTDRGISFNGCQWTVFDDIYIENSYLDAFRLSGCAYGSVTNVTINRVIDTSASYAFPLLFSYFNISNVRIDDVSTAIYGGGDNNEFWDMTFTDIANYAFHFATGATNNTVHDIVTDANYRIYNSDYNTLYDSQIGDISIETNSNDNWVYNTLINGTVSIISSTNYLNTTKQFGTRFYSSGVYIGGNYWANPTGTGFSETCADADSNGFCDSSYNPSGSNYDYLAYSGNYTAECTGSETQCDGVDLEYCSGDVWVLNETCSYGCDAGVPQCYDCTNTTQQCVGSDLELCVAGYWSLDETCTFGCDGSLLQCFDCTNSTTQCNPDDLELCTAGYWVLDDVCEYECLDDDHCGTFGELYPSTAGVAGVSILIVVFGMVMVVIRFLVTDGLTVENLMKILIAVSLGIASIVILTGVLA